MSFKENDHLQIYEPDEILYGTVFKLTDNFIVISLVEKVYKEEFNKNCGLYSDVSYHYEICWDKPQNKIIRRKIGSNKIFLCKAKRTKSERKQISIKHKNLI